MRRHRTQFLWDIPEHDVGLTPTLVTRQPFELNRCRPPAGQGCEQACHCRLQSRRVRAKARGLSKGFVDDRVERGDASDEVALDRARFRLLRSDQQECAGKPSGDFGRNRSKLGGQLAPRSTKVGPSEYDARADDADADLACARHGEDENVAVRASDRAEFVARDDHSGETGQRRRVARKVAQQRGHETARSAPER